MNEQQHDVTKIFTQVNFGAELVTEITQLVSFLRYGGAVFK